MSSSLYSIKSFRVLAKQGPDIIPQFCDFGSLVSCNVWCSHSLFNSGFFNLVTRPLGGYLGDVLYRHSGTKGKKALTLLCGLIMGASLVGGGFYLQNTQASGNPQCELEFKLRNSCLPWLGLLVAIIMGVFSVATLFSEIGNGANFALVPHCNPYNNVGLICPTKTCVWPWLLTGSFLGRHVWYCWLLWEPWWHHLRSRVQIPDRQSRQSLLDHGGDIYCTQCFGYSYLCTRPVNMS